MRFLVSLTADQIVHPVLEFQIGQLKKTTATNKFRSYDFYCLPELFSNNWIFTDLFSAL